MVLAGDAGDTGVHPVAEGEAVGFLFTAFTRQVRPADEAGEPATDRDLDTVVQHLGDRAGDGGAFLQRLGAGFEGVFGQLLDAQADPFLLEVDFEHLGLDHIALGKFLERFLARFGPVDIRQVHHAVDAAVQSDEQAELGDVLDLPLDHGIDREHFAEFLPRVVQALFQTKADAAFLRIDIQHHHLDLLAGRDNLARMHVLLGPAHLGDVDQPLDPRLQLHEAAVVGDVADPAGELGADGILGLDPFPGIGLELFHAEGYALGFGVEADDLDVDGLSDVQHLARVVDASPCHVGDMQQPVDAAEVDEGTVIGEVLDHPLDHLLFLQSGEQLGALLGTGFLEHGTARHHDVAAAAVHLENLEQLWRAHQRADVTHRADIDLASRQEGDGARQIDGEAALDAAKDRPGDVIVVLERLLQQRPGLLAAGLLAAEHRLAVAVLHAFEEDIDDIADLDFRVLAGGRELPDRDPPFRFQPDIDQDRLAVDRNHRALDDRPFGQLALDERFLQHRGEILAARQGFLGCRSLFRHTQSFFIQPGSNRFGPSTEAGSRGVLPANL